MEELLKLLDSTKKRQHYFDILKAFFVRHSSEYKTSDSDRKVNRNIYPDALLFDVPWTKSQLSVLEDVHI